MPAILHLIQGGNANENKVSDNPIAETSPSDKGPDNPSQVNSIAQECLQAAEEARANLKLLASKSDDECAAILMKLEGPEWISIGRSKDGHVVYYRDLQEHNGKLVRERLRELMESSIKRLEKLAQTPPSDPRQSR